MLKQFILKLLILSVTILGYTGVANAEKNMKENTLTVIISKPINEVFQFTTDPAKTPLWINSVAVEQTNEWPPKVGTVYKNRGHSGPWSTYKVSKFKENEEFELIKEDSIYHVNYAYSANSDGSTKLIYREWVTKGELEEPFTQETLNNLKNVMEKSVHTLKR